MSKLFQRLASFAVLAIVVAMLKLGATGPASVSEEQDAADRKSVDIPHPFFGNGRWGYIDNSGRVVIPPQFDWAKDFFEDRAAVSVRSPGKSGYIRPDGSWAVVLPDDSFPARRFSEGRAWVSRNTLMGCIDADGRIIIPATYDFAGEFSEGLALVAEGGPKWPRGRMERGKKATYGFVDRSGRIVIPLQYESASRFGDGLACVLRPGGVTFEYIDRSGKIVFSADSLPRDPRLYIGYASGFSGGRAFVSFDGNPPARPSAIFLDTKGRLTGPRETYDGAGPFSEGLARVGIRGKAGYVDTTGKIVIPARFDDGADFHEGRCRVLIGSAWQYIDSRGNIVARSTLAGEGGWNDSEDFHGGLARVHAGGEFKESDHGPEWWHGGRWSYIDRRGAVISNCRDDSVTVDFPALTIPLGKEHVARGH